MKNLILLFFLAALVACNPPAVKDDKTAETPEAKAESETKEGYILAFTKIDNNVDVYVNDTLIYTSGFIGHSPELDLEVDLTQYINDGSEVLRIELFNGREPYNDQIDPLWEVRYDLIFDGEIVEFIHEFDDDNAIGKVYEKEYVINDLKEE